MARTVARDAAGRASPRFSQVSAGKSVESLPFGLGGGPGLRLGPVSLGSFTLFLAISATSPLFLQLPTLHQL